MGDKPKKSKPVRISYSLPNENALEPLRELSQRAEGEPISKAELLRAARLTAGSVVLLTETVQTLIDVLKGIASGQLIPTPKEEKDAGSGDAK